MYILHANAEMCAENVVTSLQAQCAPACAAREATDTAVRPFCAESAMPLTSRTMAIEYSSRSDASSAGCVLASGSNWPPAHESLHHMRRVVFKGDSHRHTLVM